MPQLGVIVSEEELQKIDRYWRRSDLYKNRTDFVRTVINGFMDDNRSKISDLCHKK